MTITEKLNEIEEQTKTLAQQAQVLEENKRNYEGLLECEVNGHEWKLGGPPKTMDTGDAFIYDSESDGVVSNLRFGFTIHLTCVSCRCYILVGPTDLMDGQIPVAHSTDVFLTDLLGPEEDE